MAQATAPAASGCKVRGQLETKVSDEHWSRGRESVATDIMQIAVGLEG